MKNRKARLLTAKPGQLIRISNRLVVRYRYLGFRECVNAKIIGRFSPFLMSAIGH